MSEVRQSMIYIGLRDADTHEQKFDTDKYISILKNVCMSYRTAFSVQLNNGGYFHEDGSYVDENTLVLTLLDVPAETVNEIAKDLCAFFHQESVMVTTSQAEVCFIHDDLEIEGLRI